MTYRKPKSFFFFQVISEVWAYHLPPALAPDSDDMVSTLILALKNLQKFKPPQSNFKITQNKQFKTTSQFHPRHNSNKSQS